MNANALLSVCSARWGIDELAQDLTRSMVTEDPLQFFEPAGVR
jgi:hypothetical protein